MLDAEPMRSAAQGRWQRVILPALGIDVPHHPRKHGSCPFCGGKDRFRFDDQDGRGTWFCNQCDPQAGDGFALVMKIRRLDFRDALHLVASVLGFDSSSHSRTSRSLPPVPQRVDRRALAFRFELAALDLRIRAERVAQAAIHIDIGLSTDAELNRALGHIAQGLTDEKRASLFEHVADELRFKEFHEMVSRD